MKNPFLKPKRVLESTIEKYLVQQVERAGGICRKIVSPGHAGMPDRLAMFKNGIVVWVELKQARGMVSALQEREHTLLRSFGCIVRVVRSKNEVDELMKLYAY